MKFKYATQIFTVTSKYSNLKMLSTNKPKRFQFGFNEPSRNETRNSFKLFITSQVCSQSQTE